jgi:hypothetical protein
MFCSASTASLQFPGRFGHGHRHGAPQPLQGAGAGTGRTSLGTGETVDVYGTSARNRHVWVEILKEVMEI